MSKAKRWVFTLNNYTDTEKDEVDQFLRTEFGGEGANALSYAAYGKEIGDSGTPHLQGFLMFEGRRTLRQCKALPGLGRAHFEVSRGTPAQAATYCKKDGDYVELGELQDPKGKRSDWENLREWSKNLQSPPSKESLWQEFPSLAARYPRACEECVRIFAPKPKLTAETSEPRPWQAQLLEILKAPADDRKIIFVVDEEGGRGKSWLTRYLYDTRGHEIQRLSVGKRDDLAYAIDETKKVFLFDIPRGQSEYLQYGILESLKDRMVFSPKYTSVNKVLKHTPHVVVFMNEDPDKNRLTKDRYRIMKINF